jgi:hypothetical protein
VRFKRRYPRWGRYGLSALQAVGIEVVPTFRRPHATLAHADLDILVNGLRSCEHRILNNRYHRRPGDVRP